MSNVYKTYQLYEKKKEEAHRHYALWGEWDRTEMDKAYQEYRKAEDEYKIECEWLLFMMCN